MRIRDAIADALLEALELGADLPEVFDVWIPWQAWVAVGSEPVEVAGFVVHLRAGDRNWRPARVRH